MAHTFDTKATSAASTANPVTLAYTCGATATLLVLAIAVTTTSSVARAGGAPTYNGVAMTQAGSTRTTTTTSVELWYMLAPPTGSSHSISVPNTGTKSIILMASSYIASTGVTKYNTAVGNTGTTGTPTDTITAAAGDAVADVAESAGGALTKSKTLLYSGQNTTWYATQYDLPAGAGSDVFSYTGTSGRWGQQVGAWSLDVHHYAYAPTGGAHTGGTATKLVIHVYMASGGALSGGTSPKIVIHVYAVSGGALSGGTDIKSLTKTYVVSGGVVSGGVAAYEYDKAHQTFTYSMSGGAVSGGTDAQSLSKVYPVVGGALSDGTAPKVLTKTYAVSGGAVASGSAQTSGPVAGPVTIEAVKQGPLGGNEAFASDGGFLVGQDRHVFIVTTERAIIWPVRREYAPTGGVGTSGSANVRFVTVKTYQARVAKRARKYAEASVCVIRKYDGLQWTNRQTGGAAKTAHWDVRKITADDDEVLALMETADV